MIVLILKICAHSMNIFSFLRGVELRQFSVQKMVSGLCNLLSNSFHSFIFKLLIMIVHALKVCTSYFVHI